MKITTLGLDLAKNVFQVHGIDATGEIVVAKALRRRQVLAFFGKLEPCLVGMEAMDLKNVFGQIKARRNFDSKKSRFLYQYFNIFLAREFFNSLG